MSFNDWLSRRRMYTPDRVAIVDDRSGIRYRYADLDQRASAVAYHLQASLDIRPGDRVACLSTNRIEYIDLYFACGKIGAVLVPLNFRLPAPAIIELLVDCQAKVLVYESTFAQIAGAAEQADAIPHNKTGPRSWPIDIDTSAGQALKHVLETAALSTPDIEIYQAAEVGHGDDSLHFGHHGSRQGRHDPVSPNPLECAEYNHWLAAHAE